MLHKGDLDKKNYYWGEDAKKLLLTMVYLSWLFLFLRLFRGRKFGTPLTKKPPYRTVFC